MMIGCWSSKAFFALHLKTGQTIQPQRFQKNDRTHVPPAHPSIHNSFSFPPRPRPKAKKQPQQCQDKKKLRWQHDLASQVSPLCTLELSQPRSTNRGTQISQQLFFSHFAQWDSDLLRYKSGGSISLVANGVG